MEVINVQNLGAKEKSVTVSRLSVTRLRQHTELSTGFVDEIAKSTFATCWQGLSRAGGGAWLSLSSIFRLGLVNRRFATSPNMQTVIEVAHRRT
jgi:hypothetical protein